MDPLTVMASLTGLLTAAGSVSSILYNLKSSLTDAPHQVDHVLSEVRQAEIYLSAMHTLLTKVDSAPIKRRALIQVEQLLAILTESVFTFSELEALVKPLAAKSEISLRERAMWILKEDTVSGIVQRMQHQKSFFSLMLNIMQCGSDFEAEQDHVKLQTQQLEVNQDIYRRLRRLEDSRKSLTISTIRPRNVEPIEEEDDTATITPDRVNVDDLDEEILNYADTAVSFSFERDLNTSRVYKRTHRYKSDISYTSSIARTHAWSVFSGVSLAQVSIISAMALPVYSNEISNRQRYNFGNIVQAGPQGAAPAQKAPSPITDVGGSESVTTPTNNATSKVVPEFSIQRMAVHRIAVLGYEGVGKMTLTIQLCRKQTTSGYDPTVEDSFRRQATIDGEACVLEILNMGTYQYGIGLSDQWITACEGFMMVYSITDRKSFAYIQTCHSRILRLQENKTSPSSSPMILIGNKCDQITEREISTQEGAALARELGIDFLEASAEAGVNIEKPFFDLVRSMRVQRVLALQNKLKSTYSQWAGAGDIERTATTKHLPISSMSIASPSSGVAERAALAQQSPPKEHGKATSREPKIISRTQRPMAILLTDLKTVYHPRDGVGEDAYAMTLRLPEEDRADWI